MRMPTKTVQIPTKFKTINGESILGTGDISVASTGGSVESINFTTTGDADNYFSLTNYKYGKLLVYNGSLHESTSTKKIPLRIQAADSNIQIDGVDIPLYGEILYAIIEIFDCSNEGYWLIKVSYWDNTNFKWSDQDYFKITKSERYLQFVFKAGYEGSTYTVYVQGFGIKE